MQNRNRSDLSLDTLEAFLDYVLAATCAVAFIFGAILLSQGASMRQLLFFDIGALPWGQIWEILEGFGLTAAATRGAFWLYRKLGGDKYAIAIWKVLENVAPGGLTKEAIISHVTEITDEKRPNRFQRKFDNAWMKLRKAGEITVLEDPGRGKVYILAIDRQPG